MRFVSVCMLAATVSAPLAAWSGADSAPKVARAAAPMVVAMFSESDSTHENMVKPVTLSDGRILGLSISTRRRRQQMMGRYSSDDGNSWSSPQVLFDFPDHVGGFGYFSAMTDRDGDVYIFYLNDGNTGGMLPKSKDEKPVRAGEVLDIWYVRSRAKATKWEAPKSIWTGRAGDVMPAIQLKSGRLLLPISCMSDLRWGRRSDGARAFNYVGQFNTSAIYSDDGGATWQPSPDEGANAYTLYAPFSSTTVYSEDNGDTWHQSRNELAGGRLLNTTLAPGVWHDVRLSWDTVSRKCNVTIDGKP